MKQRIPIAMIGTVLAAAVGNAGAVALNPKGIGRALVHPYYAVNTDAQSGKLANYSSVFAHRSASSCTLSAGTEADSSRCH